MWSDYLYYLHLAVKIAVKCYHDWSRASLEVIHVCV